MSTVEEDVRKWYAEAREHVAAGRYLQALEALTRVLQHTNPTLAREGSPYHGWPEELAEAGKPNQTPDYFTAALYLSGRCLAAMNDYDKAGPFLEEAARLWPDRVPLLRELAAVYSARGEDQNALVALQEALELAPGDEQIRAEVAAIEIRLASELPA